MKHRRKVFMLALLFAGALGGTSFAQQADSSITGISRLFNPAISLNGLFYWMGTSEGHGHEAEEHGGEEEAHHHHLEPGIHIQELELAITANVSPYFKADATLSSHGEGLEVENLYLTTLQLPFGLQGRFGKMYVPFGLHNKLHTHMYPFLEPPLINVAVFGHHGWIDTGGVLSWMAPVPWYLDISVGGFEGDNPALFGSERKSDYAGFARIENLFALNDASTFRVGGSFGWGPKVMEVLAGDTLTDEQDVVNQVWGADLQFKWRPPKHYRTRAAYLQTEYLEHSRLVDDEWSDPRKGYYVSGQFQVSRWWWVQARYDWMETPPEMAFDYLPALQGGTPLPKHTSISQRWSYAVAVVPTHFEAYKLEYSIIDRGGEMEYRTYLQVNFTIGSHPAHEY